MHTTAGSLRFLRVSRDGRHRARTWHWYEDNRFMHLAGLLLLLPASKPVMLPALVALPPFVPNAAFRSSL